MNARIRTFKAMTLQGMKGCFLSYLAHYGRLFEISNLSALMVKNVIDDLFRIDPALAA
jgi:hypothetical protein